MSRMEVRCCCNPGKLLGTLEVGEPRRAGQKIGVMNDSGEIDSLTVAELHSKRDEATGMPHSRPSPLPGFCYYPAIKSDDRPMSFWRGLPGFEEAKDSPVNWE